MICPSCQKRYKTGTLSCRRCHAALYSHIGAGNGPSEQEGLMDYQMALELHHHEEQYVELAQCTLSEVKQITRLLTPEGIKCHIEKDKTFQYEPRQEVINFMDERGLIVKVKAAQFPKAHALLTWESEQETNEENADGIQPDPQEASCPSCEMGVSDDSESCSTCGLRLGTPDTDEFIRPFPCSTCGASWHLSDPYCPSCGARFDH